MIRVVKAPQPLERSLATSTALSKHYHPMIITPIEVVRALNRAKVRFTLVGAHALGGWTHRPRTTDDVDVVVAARHVKRAVGGLIAAYPQLVAAELPIVVRLRDGENGPTLVDVMKPN